jgi:hypothetical protein
MEGWIDIHRISNVETRMKADGVFSKTTMTIMIEYPSKAL